MRTRPMLEMTARIRIKKMLKLFAALLPDRRSHAAGITNPVRVLMYHRVNTHRKNELSVPTGQFEKQVAWLHAQGFVNMSMADLEAGAAPAAGTSPRVVFTFDDGYEDNILNAMPILKKFGYTGMFYLATEYIGSAGMFARDFVESNRREHNKMLSWRQVRQMVGDGMEIGSHTLTHADLKRVSSDRARREIEGSKRKLEQELDIRVTSFCYPSGRHTAEIVAQVQDSGYLSACTTEIGMWNGHDLFSIPRIAVLSSDVFFVFKQKAKGRLGWLRRIH